MEPPQPPYALAFSKFEADLRPTRRLRWLEVPIRWVLYRETEISAIPEHDDGYAKGRES